MTEASKCRKPIVPILAAAAVLAVLTAGLILSLTGRSGAAPSTGIDHPYQRPYPMPHSYWKKTDEFYAFASGGQQGGVYIYGVPSMKLLSEIPIFNIDPAWGWTPANDEVREMMTDPRTGELVLTGDTHHPVLSRKNAKYDGKWLFLNDKRNARIARDYRGRNVQVIRISPNERKAKVRGFVKEHKLHLPVLLDQDITISELYGIKYFPTMIIIDKQGVVRHVAGLLPENDLRDQLESILKRYP